MTILKKMKHCFRGKHAASALEKHSALQMGIWNDYRQIFPGC